MPTTNEEEREAPGRVQQEPSAASIILASSNDERKLKTWIFVCVVNVFLFLTIWRFVGGDALKGLIKDGHYFLESHGHLTEVPRLVWELSRLHAFTFMLSLPAFFIA
jgi:hypothetical protein